MTPTPPALDLAALTVIANGATPGPWGAEPYSYGVQDGRIRVTSPSDSGIYNLAEDVSETDAAHIAAFDPPTVLALIARVEAAESRADEAHQSRLVALERAARNHARAEAAEAKIAAVRELHRPVPVYTTEAGDCEHEGACEAVELSDGAFCPAHTDGLTCNACAQTGEHMDGLPTYPCPTIAALDGTA